MESAPEPILDTDSQIESQNEEKNQKRLAEEVENANNGHQAATQPYAKVNKKRKKERNKPHKINKKAKKENPTSWKWKAEEQKEDYRAGSGNWHLGYPYWRKWPEHMSEWPTVKRNSSLKTKIEQIQGCESEHLTEINSLQQKNGTTGTGRQT